MTTYNYRVMSGDNLLMTLSTEKVVTIEKIKRDYYFEDFPMDSLTLEVEVLPDEE